ncbi:MAG: calcium-binding protein [Pseudomonadota bacterium]
MSTQAGAHGHHMAHLDLMATNAQGVASSATHVAVRDGDWFDPDTWADGRVPNDGALVHVPEGVSVDYQGQSNAELFLLRVDGDITFTAANGAATKMVVDTIITSDNSTFTVDAAADTDGTVDIVFNEGVAQIGGYTDVSGGDGVIGRHSWDPEQLSLGLIASGKVEIKGQEVDAGLQLAEGPGAGATQLIFDTTIEDSGWAVGHKIVVGGTKFLGDNADGELITQDEVRTVTSVQEVGGQMIVTLDLPLQYDHTGPTNPQTGAELTGHVGNMSRNVTFSSSAADPDGDGVPSRGVSLGEAESGGEHYVTERGHIMFMHNDDVDVQNSAFLGLGRTDKSVPVDDLVTGGVHDFRQHVDAGSPGQYDPGIDLVEETADHLIMNHRGRYALHIHQANQHADHDDHDHGAGPCPVTGADVCECDSDALGGGVIGPCAETGDPICHCGDQDGDGIADHLDDDFVDGAYLHGNAVWGTPGWGIVQHSSDAALDGNVVYDAGGAAFVSESGDERGIWSDNLAMGTYGVREVAPNQDGEGFNEDDGAGGVGFYMKSRALDVEDNVAVSSGRVGFFWHSNGTGLRPIEVEGGDALLEDIGHGLDYINVEDVPILVFRGNEVIAAREGVRVISDPLDSVRKFNDAWSHFEDFTAWEVDESGISITYSSKYVLSDILILGTETKVSDIAQQSSAGLFFKVSVADITVVDAHIENFYNAVTNWSMVGDRQEYRRGYWDPKLPHDHPSMNTEAYEGLGQIGGIENPVYNLWNMNLVNVTHDNIRDGWLRASNITVELEDGTDYRARGAEWYDSIDDVPNDAGVEIELLGDSRDGALVALWREDIANNPDQAAMLEQHIPLAYQEDPNIFLSQIHFTTGVEAKRHSWLDYVENINADIWSGTVLEFAKEDSFGRHVFLYGDFSPLDPSAAERSVTTNERLVLSKDMIEGVLAQDGYYRVAGVDDVKFVVVNVIFSDRLTGIPEVKEVVVALDLAWELPQGTLERGLLAINQHTIVAPQYRVFDNGVLVDDRAPIVLGDPPEGLTNYVVGVATTDEADDLSLSDDSDVANAGDGDDIVRGFDGDDQIDGGDGADTLFGGTGWDQLAGGTGNDVMSTDAGDDLASGNAGNDFIDGGGDRDTLWGNDGDDALFGGADADVLFGGAGDDVLSGDAGEDVLYGGSGSDIVNGGAFTDRIFGDEGADYLHGDDDTDSLFGGDGDDVLDGGADRDFLFGGAGADYFDGGDGRDQVEGGSGDDTMSLGTDDDRASGQAGNDTINGDDGRDALWGNDGDDHLFGGADVDTLFGGSGNDAMYGDAGKDALYGGTLDDSLFGGDEADKLYGDEGLDTLFGGAGNDVLMGNLDRDFLYGGAGDDQLYGGNGRDHLEGGAGNDVMSVGTDDDRASGQAGHDTINGEEGRDTLWGNDGNDALFGGTEFDTLFGGHGDDTLFGSAGDDLLEGQTGDDTLDGGGGRDVLFGGTENDNLFGGDSADTLTGGDGSDQLTGGSGTDRFVFDSTSGQDVITDFEDGVDAIEFMIEAFGYDDLEVLQDGDDAVVTHAGGTVRLVSVDGTTLDQGDFAFSDP